MSHDIGKTPSWVRCSGMSKSLADTITADIVEDAPRPGGAQSSGVPLAPGAVLGSFGAEAADVRRR